MYLTLGKDCFSYLKILYQVSSSGHSAKQGFVVYFYFFFFSPNYFYCFSTVYKFTCLILSQLSKCLLYQLDLVFLIKIFSDNSDLNCG
jgi:hypothetical protein